MNRRDGHPPEPDALEPRARALARDLIERYDLPVDPRRLRASGPRGDTLAAPRVDPLAEGSWLLFKGLGPRRAGWLDRAAALREMSVSQGLAQQGANAAQALRMLRLTSADLAGLEPGPPDRPRDAAAVWAPQRHKAVVLLSAVRSPIRVSELESGSGSDARGSYPAGTDGDAATAAGLPWLVRLIDVLGNSILRYQACGGVHHDLQPQRVTLAGELVDLEALHLPGVPAPSHDSPAQRPAQAQALEAFAFLDILDRLSRYQGLPCTREDLARLAAGRLLAGQPARNGFARQLASLAG